MAGSASNWYKVSSGPLKGQTVYISKAQKAALGGNILSSLNKGTPAYVNAASYRPPGTAKKGGALPGPTAAPSASSAKRREFATLSAATDYAQSLTRDWGEKLNPDQTAALNDYQDAGHGRLNYALRNGTESTLDDTTIATRKALDSAFETAPPIPDAITVHRGMQIGDLGPAQKLFDSWQVGGEYRDPGFMSTSLDKSLAEGFGFGADGVKLEIRLPAGQKALYMQSNPTRDRNFDHEQEFLLPRGTRYRVVEKTKLPKTDGYHVVLEVF